MLRGKALSVALVTANVVLLGTGAVTASVLRHEDSPQDAVRSFLSALSDGDVARALDLVDQPEEKDHALLGSGVLPKGSRIGLGKIESSDVQGDHAAIEVSFLVKGNENNATFELERPKREGIRATRWHILNGLSTLDVSGADGFDSITVNGVKVALTKGAAQHPVLPGYYSGVLSASPLFTGKVTPTAASTDTAYLAVDVDVKPAALAAAKRAAERSVRDCFAKARTLIEACHTITPANLKKYASQGLVFDDAHWKVRTFPKLSAEFNEDDNTIDIYSLGPGIADVNVRLSAPKVNPGYSERVDDFFPFGVFGTVRFVKGQPVYQADS